MVFIKRHVTKERERRGTKDIFRKEREKIKENLLEEATRCIVEQGLIHTSVDSLCKKVKISKTFFYTLFPTKEDLVIQALRCQQPRALRRAQELMADARRPWRERVEQFLRDCCYGTKSSIAVLSIEEGAGGLPLPDARSAFRCSGGPDVFFTQALAVFGIPAAGTVTPRLFRNLALSMMMVYKAYPGTPCPSSSPRWPEDMVEFQIRPWWTRWSGPENRRHGPRDRR